MKKTVEAWPGGRFTALDHSQNEPKFTHHKTELFEGNISENWNCRNFHPQWKIHLQKKKHQNPFSSKSAVEIEVPDQKMMVAHCQRFVSAAQMVCRVRVVNRRSFFTWQTFSNPQRMWMPTEPMPSRGGFALDLTPLFGKLKNTLRKIEVSNHQDENQLHHHAPLSKKRLIWSSKG